MKSAIIHRNPFIIWLVVCLAIGLIHPLSSAAITARDKYHVAEGCYKKLRNNPKKQEYRHNWLQCIDKFQRVYRYDPSGQWAPAGLYMAGVLYMELYARSFKPGDKKEAADLFERILKRFPKSSYSRKAAAKIRSLSRHQVSPVSQKVVREKREKKPRKTPRTNGKTDSPPASKPKLYAPASRSDGDKTTVNRLRFWSNPNYTRVVIDVDGKPSFSHRLLKKDPVIHKPKRLLIDLSNSFLGKDIKKVIPIHDDLLINARAGQYTPDTVRVVIDIKSFNTYKIFSLRNPFRIVIDVWGDTVTARSKNRPTPLAGQKGKKLPTSALAKQLSLGVRRIVIDPGHGGRDFGAAGYLKGVFEKNIALQISRKLAKRIKTQLNCEVIMTRNRDRYLTLEERTAIANTKNADLFISIHTNASRNRHAYGIETYFLNLATDDESIRVAAMENATSEKNISDLQTILNDLMQNAKINESSRLAAHVQNNLYNYLKKKKYRKIKNKGVKQAPFYVLLGAQMPAILIETSFISNSRECKRLASAQYQNRLAEAIVEGIRAYIKETHPAANLRSPAPARDRRAG